MMDEFNLEILTPVRKYLSMKAETIIVDTDDGQRSFYSKMYDLITPLKICPLTIKYRGHITNYAIGGGTLSIDSKRNTITILVNSIESYKEALERVKRWGDKRREEYEATHSDSYGRMSEDEEGRKFREKDKIKRLGTKIEAHILSNSNR